MLRGMWDLPGPGFEPMSPALAGGFLTTVPPEKPPSLLKSNTFKSAKRDEEGTAAVMRTLSSFTELLIGKGLPRAMLKKLC